VTVDLSSSIVGVPQQCQSLSSPLTALLAPRPPLSVKYEVATINILFTSLFFLMLLKTAGHGKKNNFEFAVTIPNRNPFQIRLKLKKN